LRRTSIIRTMETRCTCSNCRTIRDGRKIACRTAVRAELPRPLEFLHSVELPAAIAWTLTADRASRTSQPTLVLRGGATLDQLASVYDDVLSLLPGAKRLVIPGATHNVAVCRAGSCHRRFHWANGLE